MISLHDKKYRQSLTAFRISAHRFRIEHGRYYEEKAEVTLCDTCQVIENEIHFLSECKKYNTLRLKLYDSIKCTNFVQVLILWKRLYI